MDSQFTLEYYKERIANLHCAWVGGKKILAKPILFLAIIQSIEDNILRKNEIPWGKDSEIFLRLKDVYEDIFTGYLPNDCKTPIFKPFYHLKYDRFWHLKLKEEVKYPQASQVGFMNKFVAYAYVDDELWQMLQDVDKRSKLREEIISKYL